MTLLVHASCVALDGKGVLLMGASGAGKSDLALRLFDQGAQLVADDQTVLHAEKGVLLASAPPALEGLLEVRPVGLLRLPFVRDIPLVLAVELVPGDNMLERMPEPACISFLDQSLKFLKLPGYAASTPAVLRAIVRGQLEVI